MWLLKAFLRLLLLLGFITIIPYVIWWIFTGLDFWETIDEIECL